MTATPDDDLPFIGAPARGALAGAGYTRLAQLPDVTAAELLALHGVGPKAIRILRAALAERGEAFAGEEPPPSRQGLPCRSPQDRRHRP